MKRLLAPLILCSTLCAALPLPAEAASNQTTAKYMCMIVLDGGRPDYITRNIAGMPNLHALLQRSRQYDRAWVGDLMSITPPGHAVIGTGSLPKNDGGIVNWDWGNHATGKISPTFQAKANYLNGYAFNVIRNSGTPTLAGVIRQKYPGLVIAGSGSHFHAAGPMGGPDASWIFSYDRNSNHYWAPYTLGGHPVPAKLLNDPSLRVPLASSNNSTLPLLYDPLTLGLQNTLVMNFGIKAVQTYRPRAMMLNLPEMDTVGHWSQKWYPEMGRLYRTFDKDLGRMIAAYKSAGIYDQTLFVITADHGIIQSKHRVLDRSQIIDKQNGVLAEVGARGILVNGGGAAGPTMMSIWIHDPSQNRKVAQTIFNRHLDNVSAVFYAQHRGSKYYYNMAGCVSCSTDLKRAYHYLLGTQSGPTGEDVAILLRENARNSGLPSMMGRHGGADWGSQHITLIMSGPGVQPGISQHPARLVDIAPTIERFMGIAPRARDGFVLADAFQHPNAADVATQSKSDVDLNIYVNALAQRAASDTQLENQGKLPNSIPGDEVIIHWKRRWAVTIAGVLVLLGTAVGMTIAIKEVRRQGTGLNWTA
ncbi:MAG: alkaline phosphatase family protein [Chloroflexota bacterium]